MNTSAPEPMNANEPETAPEHTTDLSPEQVDEPRLHAASEPARGKPRFDADAALVGGSFILPDSSAAAQNPTVSDISTPAEPSTQAEQSPAPAETSEAGEAGADDGHDSHESLASLFLSDGQDSPDDFTATFTSLAVDLDNVTVVYPGAGKPALKDVTLSIGVNDFCYLVGASGSGKTTLLKLVTGQLKTTFGHAEVLNRDLEGQRRRELARLRRRIAVVYQDIALIDNMTVAENIGYALRVAGSRNRSQISTAVRTALDVVGLGDVGNSRPAELSGGEAQRVAIARAIVTRPELILADEPTGNLDPETSASIVEVFNTVHRSGIPIVMATHDRRLVDYYPHRVIEIDAGTVVRDEAQGSYLRGVKPSKRRYLKTSTAR